jgi:hypothetical protein
MRCQRADGRWAAGRAAPRTTLRRVASWQRRTPPSNPRAPLAPAVLRIVAAQFERACKEVLREDHQLGPDGEQREFADVQVRWLEGDSWRVTADARGAAGACGASWR